MASQLPTIMDGAMGSLLISRGLPSELLPDDWNISEPKKVAQAHRDYIDSGARVILTNTFNTLQNLNSPGGMSRSLKRLEQGIQIAQKAAGFAVKVFVSLAATKDIITPSQAKEIAAHFNGLDGILLETCWSRRDLETLLLLQSASAQKGLSWGISFALQPGQDGLGKLPDQTTITEISKDLENHHLNIVGLNCCKDLSLSQMIKSLKTFQDYCQADWLIRPNGGAPIRKEKGWAYSCSLDDYSTLMQQFLPLQIRYMGGCCGIHPEHIRGLNQSIFPKT